MRSAPPCIPEGDCQLPIKPAIDTLQLANPKSAIANPLVVYLFNTICYHAGAMHQTGWAVAAVAQLGYGRGKSEH